MSSSENEYDELSDNEYEVERVLDHRKDVRTFDDSLTSDCNYDNLFLLGFGN